jgi:hypothetical protein
VIKGPLKNIGENYKKDIEDETFYADFNSSENISKMFTQKSDNPTNIRFMSKKLKLQILLPFC